jgi:phosphatidate cytidylyltransferase
MTKQTFPLLGVRVLSAIGAIVILILAMAFSPNGIIILSFITAIICAHEYATIALNKTQDHRLQWTFIAFVGVIYTTYVFFPEFGLSTTLILWASLMAALLSKIKTAEDLDLIVHLQGFTSLGLLYCGVIVSLAGRIVLWPDRGPTWFLTLLAIVLMGDIFAYFSGISMGRHKLFPALSPKKTVEGAIGGLIGSMAGGLAMWFGFFQDIPVALFIFLSIVTGIFAQTGDLFESLLKRVAQVKDSGRIMPGHGGLLDRLDGVLFALPFFYGIAYALHFLSR